MTTFAQSYPDTLKTESNNFEAELDYNDVYLTWTTVLGNNDSYFVVERSYNEGEFIEIDEHVHVMQTTKGVLYAMKDPNLKVGVYYYRLKHIYNHTSVIYSDLLLINYKVESK